MIKGSEILVRCLENEGVDTIYGVPGEENLDLLMIAGRLEPFALLVLAAPSLWKRLS